jgi:hypothetical protein
LALRALPRKALLPALAPLPRVRLAAWQAMGKVLLRVGWPVRSPARRTVLTEVQAVKAEHWPAEWLAEVQAEH